MKSVWLYDFTTATMSVNDEFEDGTSRKFNSQIPTATIGREAQYKYTLRKGIASHPIHLSR